MPIYTTNIRRVDAFVNYEVVLEAGSAEEASKLAREQDHSLDWVEVSTTIFDARRYVALDGAGEEILGSEVGDF
jgi:hypothetical protein